MEEHVNNDVSPYRLRLGIFFIALFWIPIWALAPLIADALGYSVSSVTLVVGSIQVIFGVIGLLIAGRSVFAIVKDTPRSKILSTFWHVLRHGEFKKV